MKYGRLALVAYIFSLSLSIIAAESIPSLDSFLGHTFPDNTDIRKKYWTNLITAPKEQVWAFSEKILSSQAGQVRVRSIKRAGDFLVQFDNSQTSSFSGYSQGSYVIQRDSKTGYILQAKIFLSDDPGCYVRLYPQAEGTRADVVMYGAVLKKGLVISGLIYYMLAEPFSSIVSQTRRSFDWERLFGIGERSRAASLALDLRTAFSTAPATTAMASAPAFPSFGSGSQARPSDQTQPSPSTPASLVSLICRSASVDALYAALSARGMAGQELSDAASASGPTVSVPFSALALADDSDPLVPAVPYKAFPKYEAGKGLPLAAVRAAIFLDALGSPDSAYAVMGDTFRFLVAPSFDEAGNFRFCYFVEGRELGWNDILAMKDHNIRIVRIPLDD